MNGFLRMGTDKNGDLLFPSGGYRRLKSFQLAQLIYDITVRFVELYIPAESRTCDQMVQAARSGVQNIAEGSVDAATSTKLELNLYNVVRQRNVSDRNLKNAQGCVTPFLTIILPYTRLSPVTTTAKAFWVRS